MYMSLTTNSILYVSLCGSNGMMCCVQVCVYVFVCVYARDGVHGKTGVKVMARSKQVTNSDPKLNMFSEKDSVQGKNGRPGQPQ
jgi:hypothetical protein